jgi:hypothetical protein
VSATTLHIDTHDTHDINRRVAAKGAAAGEYPRIPWVAMMLLVRARREGAAAVGVGGAVMRRSLSTQNGFTITAHAAPLTAAATRSNPIVGRGGFSDAVVVDDDEGDDDEGGEVAGKVLRRRVRRWS